MPVQVGCQLGATAAVGEVHTPQLKLVPSTRTTWWLAFSPVENDPSLSKGQCATVRGFSVQ